MHPLQKEKFLLFTKCLITIFYKNNQIYLWIVGDSGKRSKLSETDELGLGGWSGKVPFLIISTFFLTRPKKNSIFTWDSFVNHSETVHSTGLKF